MPEPDPKTGRAYICIITTFLFLCIVTGGSCLVAYVSLPESQSSFLLPILGFTLVCMPYIFWIVTVLYQITSRAFGFRMVVGGLYSQGSVATKGAGGGAISGGANNDNNNNNIDGAQILDENAKSTPSSPKNNKDVKNGDEGGRKSKRDGSSSSSSSNEASVRSHESELPLALLMQKRVKSCFLCGSLQHVGNHCPQGQSLDNEKNFKSMSSLPAVPPATLPVQHPAAPPAHSRPQQPPMYKNRLQEFTQRSSIPVPVYETSIEVSSKDFRFRSTVVVDGKSYTSSNNFSRKRDAEQDAAKYALECISKARYYSCPNILQECSRCPTESPTFSYRCREEGHLAQTCSLSRKGQSLDNEKNFQNMSSLPPVPPATLPVEHPAAPPAHSRPQQPPMYKNRLQEFTQRSSIPVPVYKTSIEGSSKDFRFRSTVVVDGKSYTSSNSFSRKRDAEQDAAKYALECISNARYYSWPNILERKPRYFDLPSGSWDRCLSCGEDHPSFANCALQKRIKSCFLCGSLQHVGNHCPQGQSLANVCLEKQEDKDYSICLRCGDSGHDMFSCTSDYSQDDLKEIRCYICKNFGHLSCFIPKPQDMSSIQVSCYNCGESGHLGSECSSCPTKSPAFCYRSIEEGHLA